MIVRRESGDTGRRVIYFYSSSIPLSYLNITKENENKNKYHISIQKSDEDSFDCSLNIEGEGECEGERGITVPMMSFLFNVIVIIRLDTHALHFLSHLQLYLKYFHAKD